MAKRKKTITLKEFQAWLDGVEELQEAGWHPNAEQWKLIRKKIASIVQEEVPVTMTVRDHRANPQETPTMPRPSPALLPPVPQTSALDGANVEMTEAAKAALQGSVPPAVGVPSGAGVDPQIKTPSVDTSDGKYDSSFA